MFLQEAKVLPKTELNANIAQKQAMRCYENH